MGRLNAKPQRAASPLGNLERVRRYRRRQRERNKEVVFHALLTEPRIHLAELLARSADATVADLARACLEWRQGRPYVEPHSHPAEEG